jgi:PAS domain S-box-containing protein
LETPDELFLRHYEGQPRLRDELIRLKWHESAILSRALKSSRATTANRKELDASAMGRAFTGGACLIVPVWRKNGPEGVLIFRRNAATRAVDGRAVMEAEAIAAALGAVLTLRSKTPHASRSEFRTTGLMSHSTEAKPFLLLPEFVRDFTARAAEMLSAREGFLALSRGASLETIFTHDFDGRANPSVRSSVDVALTRLAEEHPEAILIGSAASFLGVELAQSLGWRNLCLIRLIGRGGDLLGVLCLIDRPSGLSEADRNLIHALAGHASVALENSRLFSRIEQSKRQWVEDFDAIGDLIVVHDPANRILRVNRSLAQALGSRPSGLVGVSVSALHTIASSKAGTGCPFCSEGGNQTDEFVLNAGARAYLVSTSRIGAGAEEGSRTIHILKDITEQRSYQAQLQRERDFNTKILNHTQSMILVLDTAGLISYANRRCYEAGFQEKDLLGRPLTEFVPRDRRASLDKAFQGALQGVASENLELPFLYGNRSTGQFSISLSPMRDEVGQVNSVVVVMSDITDARVLQAQLRHSEKMAALGQLVSGVAHEINNPLAAIVGYSDLLLENSSIPEQAKEELCIVLKEAERTKEIVQNLLRFARQMPSRRERLDTLAILRQVVQIRAYGAASEGVEVIERPGLNVSPIFGDADQLQQVFLNILNNAYDAVREVDRKGRIEISTAERGGMVEIAIRDNGTGVSETDRIFEPFYTTKEVGKGTGLGLSICYGIVREHGGEIACVNNSDRSGCTFFVRFPAASEATIVSAAEAGR